MNSQLFRQLLCYKARGVIPQSTYIPRVPQCLSPRRNWDPPPHALANKRVRTLPEPKGRTHSPCGWGGGPNSDDWRKSLEFCLLCGSFPCPDYRWWCQSKPSLQRKKFLLCGLDIYFPNIEDLWYCGNSRQFTLLAVKNMYYCTGWGSC